MDDFMFSYHGPISGWMGTALCTSLLVATGGV